MMSFPFDPYAAMLKPFSAEWWQKQYVEWKAGPFDRSIVEIKRAVADATVLPGQNISLAEMCERASILSERLEAANVRLQGAWPHSATRVKADAVRIVGETVERLDELSRNAERLAEVRHSLEEILREGDAADLVSAITRADDTVRKCWAHPDPTSALKQWEAFNGTIFRYLMDGTLPMRCPDAFRALSSVMVELLKQEALREAKI